jgi:hypothetical protein
LWANEDSQIAQAAQDRKKNRREEAILSPFNLFIISMLTYSNFPFLKRRLLSGWRAPWYRDPDAKRLHAAGAGQRGELCVSAIHTATGAKGQTVCRIAPFQDRRSDRFYGFI